MNTENWRIRVASKSMFFVEADLPGAEENGHYPRVEVMQEDYGDHNGYTEEMRMADAKLIVAAPQMAKVLMYLNNCGGLGSEKHKLIEDVLKSAGRI